jgi:hypothetical protein
LALSNCIKLVMRVGMNRQALAVQALIALGVMARSAASFGQLSDTFTNWADHPAIAYHATSETHDPVAELNWRLRDGRVRLAYSGRSGYLRVTLDAVQVPLESQIAVFVQDSVQRQRISFANPRTIFSTTRWPSDGCAEGSSSSRRKTRSRE